MNPDKEFWAGKRVLVTGHTGFKGSWLSIWLQRMGADVTGYSLSPPTSPNMFEDARVAQGMHSCTGDIRDLDTLQGVVSGRQPEIILHLAAQPLVRYSYTNPVETYATNVMGTVNLLEAARHAGSVRVILCITSDKCYENREWLWGYRENEPMGGHDPYSSSKGCSELVIAAYRHSYFSGQQSVAVASARAGNVIGGGDWAEDRLIPDIVRAMMSACKVIIRNPEAIRPWQHVLEPLSGYLLLAEGLWRDPERYAGGCNFGPHDSDARPVSWIADRLTCIWGGDAGWSLDGREHPYEARYLKLDISKARMLLKYEPRLDLGLALEWVAQWYLAYQRGDNVRLLTEQQIKAFEAMG